MRTTVTIDQIDAWLPQTQCTRCGFPDCRAYAEALATGDTDINRCPPGGDVTLHALAKLLGRGKMGGSRFCAKPQAVEHEFVALNEPLDVRSISWLRFHRIEDTKTRGGFLFFGWHSTAAISDKASGKLFAVDSWFFDNGVPPVILPLEAWQNGWQPPSTPAHQAASHD